MRILTRPQAAFPLALQLRSAEGASLGEVFTFASGLYFRGKRLYAQAFSAPPRGVHGGLVITPGRGLLPLTHRVRPDDLAAFARVPVDEGDPRFRDPLLRAARALSRKLGPDGRAVLLGSVATAKYTALLRACLGDRLWFPEDFVGRGDMSRGALMLRAVRAGREMSYARVGDAPLKGKRPAKLPPRPKGRRA